MIMYGVVVTHVLLAYNVYGSHIFFEAPHQSTQLAPGRLAHSRHVVTVLLFG